MAPKGDATRPTSDRAKESLFSALFDTDELQVLDLYAGTGALGLEALSRGASHCTFVERGRPALAALNANIEALKATEARVVTTDVARALKTLAGKKFDLIFADPPYSLTGAAAKTVFDLAQAALASEGKLIWEHRHSTEPPATPTRKLRCGEAVFSIYQS